MPVEIKELIIRTNIVSDNGARSRPTDKKLSEKEMGRIVDSCVNKVMKIMDRKKER